MNHVKILGAAEYGHTSPSAYVPFGMVQVGKTVNT
jgi:hypothetical protein